MLYDILFFVSLAFLLISIASNAIQEQKINRLKYKPETIDASTQANVIVIHNIKKNVKFFEQL